MPHRGHLKDYCGCQGNVAFGILAQISGWVRLEAPVGQDHGGPGVPAKFGLHSPGTGKQKSGVTLCRKPVL